MTSLHVETVRRMLLLGQDLAQGRDRAHALEGWDAAFFALAVLEHRDVTVSPDLAAVRARAESVLALEEQATRAAWEADVTTTSLTEEEAAQAAWQLATDTLRLLNLLAERETAHV